MALAALTLFAVIAFATRWYLDVRDTTSIETIVRRFNQEAYKERGKDEHSNGPPLTTQEILNFLRTDDKCNGNASDQHASIFKRIVRTKRIPNNVVFKLAASERNPDGTLRWRVVMDVIEGYSGHRVVIKK